MEIMQQKIHVEPPHILLMHSAYVTVSFVNSQSALFPNHLLYRKLLEACISSHVSIDQNYNEKATTQSTTYSIHGVLT